MTKRAKRNIHTEDNVAETEASGFSCVECGGDNYSRLSDLPDQQYCGIKNGEAFNTIKRSTVRCVCGQIAVVVTYV